ncbi:hypothetical protein [Xanthocytophaga agilis]|uniref:Uncharacterized protein n=1 Tax=Xanthocytophaga agilis TaxID=3048010 RepID=A0AAE3R8U4_9BACT|nr:hypothetical protein [Xanthocytophaga agilis]MDJ1505991.1 hypothetical protein [Xanthocytophaga agilis]
MQKKVVSSLFFILFGIAISYAQSADLGRLLQERDQLYHAYDSLGKEKNAFFGGRSKKDLQNMILALHRIISKDNEIIREVRRTSYQKESNLFGQNRASSDRIYDLDQQVTSLTNQLKRKNTELQDQQAAMGELLGAMRKLQIGVVVLTALVIGIGFYMFRQRRK